MIKLQNCSKRVMAQFCEMWRERCVPYLVVFKYFGYIYQDLYAGQKCNQRRLKTLDGYVGPGSTGK